MNQHCSIWLLAICFVMVGGCDRGKTYKMPTGSMEPTIKQDDTFRVDHNAYRAVGDIKRWDIIVYEMPGNKELTVKRVAALPGETIQWSDYGVMINGTLLEIPAHLKTILKNFEGPKVETGHQSLPANAVFVIGDRIEASKDSRYDGPVDFGAVRGKVVSVNDKPVQ